MKISKLAAAIDLMSTPLGHNILTLLQEEGEQCVTDIYYKLKIEQPHASHYLRKLLHCNLVNNRREGKFIYYSINRQLYENIVKFENEHFKMV